MTSRGPYFVSAFLLRRLASGLSLGPDLALAGGSVSAVGLTDPGRTSMITGPPTRMAPRSCVPRFNIANVLHSEVCQKGCRAEQARQPVTVRAAKQNAEAEQVPAQSYASLPWLRTGFI